MLLASGVGCWKSLSGNLPVFQVKSCRSGVAGTEGRDTVVPLCCQS